MPGQPFGVYLHVPFCLTRCGYCDFNTYTPAQLGGVSPDRWLLAHAGGARTGGRQAGRTDGAYRVCGWRDAIAARGGAPGHVAGHGAGPLCAGARRRSQHRGQPRVDVAGVLRHDPRGRLHAGVARHAVGGPEGAGNLGPGALAGPGGGRGHRGDSGGLHTRQPRPDLWNPGGVRRRPGALSGRRGAGRCGSCVRVCLGRRARHGTGSPGSAW
ncbi:coproporphyrinogen III oxidase [Mycobacterium tuberculosis str. Haarlem/NITR202]|uniref:Coproporphyrinogen III oxidase n=1 Tax=Mycobacterium tuberculosis str. Haarlem/NITR202 TaxID=1304279 RepID=R4LX51_MYCTX|nr:coproporphyrinogen III oxidase [Mycobacterium tuberculosis str. Haarlem/NITR202]